MARKKFTDVPKKVREIVYKRDSFEDYPCCIICGIAGYHDMAHYTSRNSNGLGIEENLANVCRSCHYRMDQTIERKELKKQFRLYLESKYENWNEEDLIYRR